MHHIFLFFFILLFTQYVPVKFHKFIGYCCFVFFSKLLSSFCTGTVFRDAELNCHSWGRGMLMPQPISWLVVDTYGVCADVIRNHRSLNWTANSTSGALYGPCAAVKSQPVLSFLLVRWVLMAQSSWAGQNPKQTAPLHRPQGSTPQKKRAAHTPGLAGVWFFVYVWIF